MGYKGSKRHFGYLESESSIYLVQVTKDGFLQATLQDVPCLSEVSLLGSRSLKLLKPEAGERRNCWSGEVTREVREPKRELDCQIETHRKERAKEGETINSLFEVN